MIAKQHRLLVVLTLSSAVAVVDRQLISILQEPIKHDLNLTDTQLGLLTGFAFSLFYATFGIPLGRLADRTNRRNLLSISLVAWSGMTAVTAYAMNFTHILLARMGVAIGEASVTPSSTSIISDTYPPRRLAFATAFYTNGFQLGLLIGFLAGGWLESVLGWRNAFLVASIPGIILAIVLRFGFKEPARTSLPSASHVTLREGLAIILAKRTLRLMAPAVILSSMAAYTLMSWSAPYLIRVHDMSLLEAGTWLAMGFGVGGFFGNLITGALVDKLTARDVRWYLWLPALLSGGMVPFLIAAAYAPTEWVIWLLLVPFCFIVGHSGTCITLVNRVTPPSFRATAVSIYLLMTNILGMGVGVTAVGMLSDHFAPTHQSAAIAPALFIVVIGACLLSIAPYLAGSRHLKRDIDEAARSNAQVV